MMKQFRMAACLAAVGLMTCLFSMTAFAAEPPKVIDNADLLTDEEEQKLEEELTKISDQHQMTVAVYTTDSTDGAYIVTFADDLFDHNGYGYGDTNDGVLLVISMEDRDWCFSTAGEGLRVMTDYGLERVEEKIVPELKNGNYYKAFSKYGECVDDFANRAEQGNVVDYNNHSGITPKKDPFNIGFALIASLVVGLVVSLIRVGSMKKACHMIQKQDYAAEYNVKGSMNVRDSSEVYLYSTVSKVKKPEPSSSSGHSGGSSSHSSSSGVSHGGSHGHF